MLRKFTCETKVIRFSRYYIKMLKNPAGERNKQPILETLQQYIDVNKESRLLEISSGCGLHSSFLSSYFPMTNFQPSEYDINLFRSIREYTKDCRNVKDPISIDISKDLDSWDSMYDEQILKSCLNTFDYMLNINMIHITPFECSEGLFKNCSKLLKTNGLLFTYGPYKVNNVLSPESNVAFDKSLRRQNPSWGIRDISDLKVLAQKNSMNLHKIHNLPSNNKLLVWNKI